MMTVQSKIVGVRELRGKLSEYLHRAAAGEDFDVVLRGKKVAELRAPEAQEDPDWPSADPKSPNFRKPGALKGKVWMSDDFDDPLPEMEAMREAAVIMTEDKLMMRYPVSTIPCA